jgi:hypothetical protein
MTHASGDLLPARDEVNVAQREYWATEGPRQYQEYSDTNEALLAPFGQAMPRAPRPPAGALVHLRSRPSARRVD